MADHEELEATCRDIARDIERAVAARYGETQVGFALLLFDFDSGRPLTYLSNAARADMITALQKCAARLLAADEPPRSGRTDS